MTVFATRVIQRLVHGKAIASSPAFRGNACYLNAFGEMHPDKYIYVIRQPGMRGELFSFYSSVLVIFIWQISMLLSQLSTSRTS